MQEKTEATKSPVLEQKQNNRQVTQRESHSLGQGKKAPIQAKGFNGEALQPIQSKQGNLPPIQARNGQGKPLVPVQRQAKSKQRVTNKVKTTGGTWHAKSYKLIQDKDIYGQKKAKQHGVRGVDMLLAFEPNAQVNATKIALIQTVQTWVNGELSFVNDHSRSRAIANEDSEHINTGQGETDEGTSIDQAESMNNPIYGNTRLEDAEDGLKETSYDDNDTKGPTSPKTLPTKVGFSGKKNANYQLGFRFPEGKKWKKQPAILADTPRRTGASKNSRHVFETTALAIEGNDAPRYYGSVRWGWRTDNEGKASKIPLEIISADGVSNTFKKAAKLWNESQTSEGHEVAMLPLVED